MTTIEILDALKDDVDLFGQWSQNILSSDDIVRELTKPKPHTYILQFEVEFKTTKEFNEVSTIEQAILKGVVWSFDVKSIAAPKDVKVKLINI